MVGPRGKGSHTLRDVGGSGDYVRRFEGGDRAERMAGQAANEDRDRCASHLSLSFSLTLQLRFAHRPPAASPAQSTMLIVIGIISLDLDRPAPSFSAMISWKLDRRCTCSFRVVNRMPTPP